MKWLSIFFITFLLLFSINLYAQSIKVNYKCSNKNKVEDVIEQFPEAQRPIIMNLKDMINNYTIIFRFNQNNLYSSFRKLDTQNDVAIDESDMGSGKFYLEEKDDNLFKDFSSNTIIANKNRHGRNFHIRDSFPDFCWNLTSEKKEILGYFCTKAIISDYYGKQITAWFASEIPIPNGPLEFGGLPGLILELTTKSLKYEAVEIQLNPPKETFKIEPPKQVGKKIISMAEFFKKTKKIKSFGK